MTSWATQKMLQSTFSTGMQHQDGLSSVQRWRILVILWQVQDTNNGVEGVNWPSYHQTWRGNQQVKWHMLDLDWPHSNGTVQTMPVNAQDPFQAKDYPIKLPTVKLFRSTQFHTKSSIWMCRGVTAKCPQHLGGLHKVFRDCQGPPRYIGFLIFPRLSFQTVVSYWNLQEGPGDCRGHTWTSKTHMLDIAQEIIVDAHGGVVLPIAGVGQLAQPETWARCYVSTPSILKAVDHPGHGQSIICKTLFKHEWSLKKNCENLPNFDQISEDNSRSLPPSTPSNQRYSRSPRPPNAWGHSRQAIRSIHYL